jgi:hypothetical protein
MARGRGAGRRCGANWLIDVIIANDLNQWWSLHELTTGTTEWAFVPRMTRRRRTFA